MYGAGEELEDWVWTGTVALGDCKTYPKAQIIFSPAKDPTIEHEFNELFIKH